jgi:hypothetical protein
MRRGLLKMPKGPKGQKRPADVIGSSQSRGNETLLQAVREALA